MLILDKLLQCKTKQHAQHMLQGALVCILWPWQHLMLGRLTASIFTRCRPIQ